MRKMNESAQSSTIGEMKKLFILWIISFTVFLLTTGGPTPYNYFVRLSDAFLHGRLYLTEAPPWLSEVVPASNNRFFVVQPPMASILLLPFVFLFGAGFEQQIFAHMIGATISVVGFLLMKRLGRSDREALWGYLLTAFGTIMWYEASTGSVWYLGQLVACLFLLLGILELYGKRRPFLIGLFISAAYLSRVHTILSVPFFLFSLFYPMKLKITKEYVTRAVKFFLGLSVFGIFNALYNYARWGVIWDKGYFLIPGIFEEPWFSKGMLNVAYIPDHLSLLFAKLPIFLDKSPYIQPSWYGLAIWITTPAFIYSLKTLKRPIHWITWSAIFAIFLILSLRGGTGWTQFGYRYAVDFYPFLILLTFLGLNKKKIGKVPWILLFIGIIVNLWGVLWINKFGWVSY